VTLHPFVGFDEYHSGHRVLHCHCHTPLSNETDHDIIAGDVHRFVVGIVVDATLLVLPH
jgi:hypothetical protein